jgi:hypothetical protein
LEVIMRRLLLLALFVFPISAFAAEAAPTGKVLAVVDGQERWLAADELNGYPGYIVKVKAYRGETLESESEITFIKGYPATVTNSRTRGYPLEDGTYGRHTWLPFFMLAEDTTQREGRSSAQLESAPYLPVLARAQKLSFGNLDVYLYSQNADRYELEVYHNDFHGYALDYSQGGLPVATLRAPTQAELIGTFSGVLHPTGEPIYVELPPSLFPVPVEKSPPVPLSGERAPAQAGNS